MCWVIAGVEPGVVVGQPCVSYRGNERRATGLLCGRVHGEQKRAVLGMRIGSGDQPVENEGIGKRTEIGTGLRRVIPEKLRHIPR